MSTVCQTNTAECEVVLGGANLFASSSSCATGAIQTANEFCLTCAAASSLVSRTYSSLDANDVTSLS